MVDVITALIIGYLAATIAQLVTTLSEPLWNRPRMHPMLVALLWPIQLMFTKIPLIWFASAFVVAYLLA